MADRAHLTAFKGTFAVLGVSYASEVCPISLRAFMTGWICVCWSIGGLMATGVTTGLNQLEGYWVSSVKPAAHGCP